MKHPHTHLLTKCPSCSGPLAVVIETLTSEEMKVCDTCGWDEGNDPGFDETGRWVEKAIAEWNVLQNAATEYAKSKAR